MGGVVALRFAENDFFFVKIFPLKELQLLQPL